MHEHHLLFALLAAAFALIWSAIAAMSVSDGLNATRTRRLRQPQLNRGAGQLAPPAPHLPTSPTEAHPRSANLERTRASSSAS
ncbi:hypothetical protein Pla111_27740 [Botrimarina hoheduenensis]|uniref:Uncharacterized protein n=1 Tax=Botrimarina hoheduenensis TaxID=2528000 RepID=A0A5C5VXL7_9BACT|nr:hypothetical protein Pla111_27740 [Botrimarina hoheduenensis]